MKGISLSSLNPGPVFNDKEIAERESEPVLSGDSTERGQVCVKDKKTTCFRILVSFASHHSSIIANFFNPLRFAELNTSV